MNIIKDKDTASFMNVTALEEAILFTCILNVQRLILLLLSHSSSIRSIHILLP